MMTQASRKEWLQRYQNVGVDTMPLRANTKIPTSKKLSQKRETVVTTIPEQSTRQLEHAEVIP